MWAVLLSALQAFFTWAWPRVVALLSTAVVAESISTPLMDWIHGQIDTRLSGLPAIAANFVSFTGIPESITIIFAAYTALISLKAAKAAFAKKSSGGSNV